MYIRIIDKINGVISSKNFQFEISKELKISSRDSMLETIITYLNCVKSPDDPYIETLDLYQLLRYVSIMLKKEKDEITVKVQSSFSFISGENVGSNSKKIFLEKESELVSLMNDTRMLEAIMRGTENDIQNLEYHIERDYEYDDKKYVETIKCMISAMVEILSTDYDFQSKLFEIISRYHERSLDQTVNLLTYMMAMITMPMLVFGFFAMDLDASLFSIGLPWLTLSLSAGLIILVVVFLQLYKSNKRRRKKGNFDKS